MLRFAISGSRARYRLFPMMTSSQNRDRFQAAISIALLALFFIVSIVFGWLGWQANLQQQAKWRESNRLTYLALETKFLAADFNGWQTAYAFDVIRGVAGATDDEAFSRRHFLESSSSFDLEINQIKRYLKSESEQERWQRVHVNFQQYMEIDKAVIAAYRSGEAREIQRANELVLGREIDLFTEISRSTEELIILVLNLSNQILEEAESSSNFAYRMMLLCGICILFLLNFSVSRANRFVDYQRKLLHKIGKIAHTDGLTGIANRRVWDDELPKLAEQAELQERPLTVVILDLDHFKKYNDTKGHQAGDLLLKTTAQAWDDQLRAGDLLARYGGEEFGLLLPKCSPENAFKIVERLRHFVPDDQTFSAGIAQWDGLEKPEETVARADEALYQAKANGRNCTEFAQVCTSEEMLLSVDAGGQTTPNQSGTPA